MQNPIYLCFFFRAIELSFFNARKQAERGMSWLSIHFVPAKPKSSSNQPVFNSKIAISSPAKYILMHESRVGRLEIIGIFCYCKTRQPNTLGIRYKLCTNSNITAVDHTASLALPFFYSIFLAMDNYVGQPDFSTPAVFWADEKRALAGNTFKSHKFLLKGQIESGVLSDLCFSQAVSHGMTHFFSISILSSGFVASWFAFCADVAASADCLSANSIIIWWWRCRKLGPAECMAAVQWLSSFNKINEISNEEEINRGARAYLFSSAWPASFLRCFKRWTRLRLG